MFNMQKGHSVEVELQNAGGSIVVITTCNPLKLHGDELTFFCQLADLVRTYQGSHQVGAGAADGGGGRLSQKAYTALASERR